MLTSCGRSVSDSQWLCIGFETVSLPLQAGQPVVSIDFNRLFIIKPQHFFYLPERRERESHSVNEHLAHRHGGYNRIGRSQKKLAGGQDR